jgi:hypothetical protein
MHFGLLVPRLLRALVEVHEAQAALDAEVANARRQGQDGLIADALRELEDKRPKASPST